MCKLHISSAAIVVILLRVRSLHEAKHALDARTAFAVTSVALFAAALLLGSLVATRTCIALFTLNESVSH